MIEKLLLKIRERYNFSADEARLLEEAMAQTATFERHQVMVPEDEPISYRCADRFRSDA